MFFVVLALVGGGYGIFWWRWEVKSPNGQERPPRQTGQAKSARTLEKYDFDSLRKRGGRVSEIIIGCPDALRYMGHLRDTGCPPQRAGLRQGLDGVGLRRKEKIDFESKQFSFESEGKKITGMINYRLGKKSPAVVMIRGYVDKEGYYSGSGTWRVADELAKEGFVTVSIDFLGFGGSDGESVDMLEARFEKAPAVMDLIASVKTLDFVDAEKIGIWAHSNGGQIAISVLEALGERIPTVLWAPMTNPFPKSVLDTADDLDDGGRMVKKAIREFEKKYDSRRYSFENYYDWVNASIVIHQGTGDYWCKMDWQVEVISELVKRGKEASLRVWPGDDHNLSKNWEEIVAEDVIFFKKQLAI